MPKLEELPGWPTFGVSGICQKHSMKNGDMMLPAAPHCPRCKEEAKTEELERLRQRVRELESHRGLAFPEAKSFGELFEVIPEPREEPLVFNLRRELDSGDRGSRVEVSSHCSIMRARGYYWVNVRPSREVFGHIRANFLGPPYDRVSFCVVVRGDSTALVVARNSLILADSWLALVPESTVPKPRVK